MGSIEIKKQKPTTEEQRRYSPIILGAHHRPGYIQRTIEVLGRLGLEGKKVMLEITDYPIPQKHRERNPGFYEYFDAIARFVLEQGGEILPGDSEELVEYAQSHLEFLWKARTGFMANNPEYEHWILSAMRDPHFLTKAKDLQPDIIVLDLRHASYIGQGIGIEYTRID